MKNISSDKASDMQTIRLLRNNVLKKRQDFERILLKLAEIEMTNKELFQFMTKFPQGAHELNKSLSELKNVKIENGRLK